jgi:hypothetical protein
MRSFFSDYQIYFSLLSKIYIIIRALLQYYNMLFLSVLSLFAIYSQRIPDAIKFRLSKNRHRKQIHLLLRNK